jgi:hypothetical protein
MLQNPDLSTVVLKERGFGTIFAEVINLMRYSADYKRASNGSTISATKKNCYQIIRSKYFKHETFKKGECWEKV